MPLAFVPSDGESMIIVPAEQLQPHTLEALIEDFITRRGAVHGHRDVPLDVQVESVRRQLANGKAAIIFDEEDESWNIVSRDELKHPPIIPADS